MFLKFIEIRGFKSFADKIDLNFKKGITALVGPNGSGKSNVSDAVRWVLGEQSIKSLRGGKMEDVIFAGTEFRKPLGLAQVSLVLDNEQGDLNIQYSQVKITRRLYRSGESDYFINNSKCRLKDIQELFMDTGIGKEGYSIIGQGKIDAILGGRPEERRALLEEAAGIVKFKTRKEEAEKKLSNTEDNLVRIIDILNTYEERLEPLKIEMEKAKKFVELSNELKSKDLALTIDIISNIENKISIINESNINNDKILKEYEEEQLRLKNVLKEYAESLEQHDVDTKNNRENYYKSKENINNIENDIKIMEEKINNFSMFIRKYQDDIKKLQDEISSSNMVKDSLEKEIDEIKEEYDIHNKAINHISEELDGIEEKIREKNIYNKKLEDELQSISNNINLKIQYRDNIKREVEILEEKIININSNIENLQNSLSINNTTKKAIQNKEQVTNEEIKQLEENLKSNTHALGNLRSKLKIAENKHKSCDIGLNKEKEKMDLLLNLESQYEGYSKTIKMLMDSVEKGLVRNVSKCFVLGDIIEVHEKYEKAIEISLGASISNIITSNEREAKVLINYLKEKKLGRATFLPLNIIKGKTLSSLNMLKTEKGFIGSASSLIKCKEEFKKAIEFTLGNVIVVHDMDTALHIAKLINYSNRIVTLEGEVINVGGSLTGGSTYSKSSNIISRKREINNCKDNIKNKEVELDSISKKLDIYNRELISLDNKDLDLREEIHSKNIDSVKLREKINSLSEEENRCRELLENYNKDLKESRSKVNFFKNNFSNTENEIKILNTEKINLIRNIEYEKNNISECNKDIESKKENLFNLKVEIAKVTENITNKNNNLKNINELIFEKNSKIKELNLEQQQNLISMKKLKEDISNKKLKLNYLNEEIKGLEAGFIVEEQQRVFLKEKIKLIESTYEQVSSEKEKIDKDKNKALMNLTKLETEKEGIVNKLNDDYSITFAEALDYKKDNLDYNKIKKDIAVLRENISVLGVVNVGAIEEYKEVQCKYTFMKEQKIDLEKSKNEILKIIDEMTFKMRKVFKENFQVLNEYFHETFRDLFKGGRASLILSEGDELDGKIEINVQPPGKKLQNINLMSGGEKVLSAIALLFSILKMKPTPFCILDEIEAALDDANVARYAEFLKKFSNRIQFIVITHRKGTMEVSDALYGVTMEEKGVSKIVSINLNKNINI